MTDTPHRPEDPRPASKSAVHPDSVAGVYRASRPWAVRAWAVLAVWWALAAVLSFHDGQVGGGLAQAALAVATLGLVGLQRAQCTVVSESGLRVRPGLRARTFTWDQLHAIHDLGRWSGTLALTTTTGEQVPTHIPRDRRAELEAYATAHGAGATPEPGPPGTEAP